MKKQIQLSIPTPCHENWDKMNPVERGRFCDSCQKKVIDFSNMSDREIAAFFKKPSTGSVCGRFMEDQLERSIEIPKKRIPWVKYFFQILIPGYLISCNEKMQGKIKINESSNEITTKQTRISVTTGLVLPEIIPDTTENLVSGIIELEPNKTYSDKIFKKEPVSDTTTVVANKEILSDNTSEFINIKGKVIDEREEPIPNANIEVINKHLDIETDSVGRFSMIEKSGDDLITLNISAVGYQTKQINYVIQANPINEIIIQMEPDIKRLPEVVVGSGIIVMGRLQMRGLCSVTRKRPLEPISKSEEDIIKVYPNPVKATSAINLAWQKKKNGTYSIQLFNLSGQSVFTKEIYIDDEARVLNFQLPSVSAGNYFLRMTNKQSGKSNTEKIIIQ